MGLLLLATLPAAEAQSQPPFFTFRNVETAGGTITKAEGLVTVYFNFTVAADQTNDATSQFEIIVTVNMTSKLPNGWVVSPIDKQSPVKMTPGQRASISVTVSTVANADGAEGTVSFKAHAKPVFKGSPSPLSPVQDQLIKSMSQESDSGEKTATVKRDLDVYQQITGLAKAKPWMFLLLAGGIFVLGVVLVRRKKGGLGVHSDSPTQQVLPGRGASFPVKVANQGGSKQTITLGTSDVPEGWAAILPVDRIELEGNETTTIWLTLKAPPHAHPGEHVQVNFIATAADGASSETLLEAAVVPSYGEPMAPQPMAAPMPSPSPRRRR